MSSSSSRGPSGASSRTASRNVAKNASSSSTSGSRGSSAGTKSASPGASPTCGFGTGSDEVGSAAGQLGSGSVDGTGRGDSGGGFGNGSTDPISAVGIDGGGGAAFDGDAFGDGAAVRPEFAIASRGGGTFTSCSFGRCPCGGAVNLPSESSSVSIACRSRPRYSRSYFSSASTS